MPVPACLRRLGALSLLLLPFATAHGQEAPAAPPAVSVPVPPASPALAEVPAPPVAPTVPPAPTVGSQAADAHAASPPAAPTPAGEAAGTPDQADAEDDEEAGVAQDEAEPTETSLGDVARAKIAGNRQVANFAHAKVHLAVLYAERPRTLYSDCPFDEDKQIDYDRCRFRPHFGGQRAHRIEWEHVVPAEAFGRAFAAWREGHPSCVDGHGRSFRGRRCAERASRRFRHMEADLYNLVPEIGELNQLRGNKPMGEPARARRALLSLPTTFVGADAFLPREQVRGDVARTYLYMQAAYPGCGIVGKKRARFLAAWDKSDPVDAWECRRAWRIEAIQGNVNPFVKTPCLEAGLWPG